MGIRTDWQALIDTLFQVGHCFWQKKINAKKIKNNCCFNKFFKVNFIF